MLYFDVAEYGWTYTVLSSVGFFVVGDFGLYWAHRSGGCVRKGPYRFAHCIHHRYRTPSAFTAVAAHPFELLTFQVVTMAPIFLVPLHPGGVIAVLLYQVLGLADRSLRDPLWDGPSRGKDPLPFTTITTPISTSILRRRFIGGTAPWHLALRGGSRASGNLLRTKCRPGRHPDEDSHAAVRADPGRSAEKRRRTRRRPAAQLTPDRRLMKLPVVDTSLPMVELFRPHPTR